MKHSQHDRILRRKKRISLSVRGNDSKPRISVYRSNKYIYAQAIDDVARVTLAFSSSLVVKKGTEKAAKKSEQAKQVGIAIGKQLMEKKVKAAVYDRGQYAYNGRVKALAEGVREAGIQI